MAGTTPLFFTPPNREAIGPRLALLDADKQLVFSRGGLPVRGYVLRPITMGAQTIGWLGLLPLRRGSHPLELAFVEQTRAICLAGCCVFALAGLVSFVLSKHFLLPITTLTEAAKRLSSLDFSAQIDVQPATNLGNWQTLSIQWRNLWRRMNNLGSNGPPTCPMN